MFIGWPISLAFFSAPAITRIRARFGFDGKLNEDFSGGIYLATGSLGDPTTTTKPSPTISSRKTIALDRAFTFGVEVRYGKPLSSRSLGTTLKAILSVPSLEVGIGQHFRWPGNRCL
jgi:hypothetical protein